MLDVGIELYGFKFALGDMVIHKGWLSLPRTAGQCLVITGQHLEICSGGKQRTYSVRAILGRRSQFDLEKTDIIVEAYLTTVVQFVHEEEIVPCSPDEFARPWELKEK